MVGTVNRICAKKYSLILVFVIYLMFLLILSFWPTISKAETNDASFLWSDAKPITYSSKITPYTERNYCPGFFQTKDVVGEIYPVKVCVTRGEKVSYGYYYVGNAYKAVISFSLDKKMYRVNNICYRYDGCFYIPESDTLVTKQYLPNSSYRSLVVYKNFTKRLYQIINSANLTLEYNFDSTNPDYILQTENNYGWPVGGLNISNNGKWLAVEIMQRGIGLLNVETLQMKRVSTIDFHYGVGMDPSVEFAISNDGSHMAVMGNNAGIMIFDIDQYCGDIATDENMVPISPIINQCKQSPIDVTDFISHFKNANEPLFSNDGGELTFFSTSYSNEIRQVSLRASGYKRDMIDYLALGDSFSSGEGESDDSYYLNGTNDEYEKCHISTRSYPFLVANMLKINPLRVKNVACSGATTLDVIGDDDSYWGQGDRLGKKYLKLIPSDKILAQTEANMQFIPGRIHQIKFVENYNPKVITIGIGGNDTGLMSKLRTCVGQGTCEYASSDISKERTAIEIKGLYGILVNTYQKLHIASPNSKIYVIGYPKVIDSLNQCDFLNGVLLDSTERQFMNEGIIYINQVIKAAAKTVGVSYIETQNVFGDQVLCGNQKPSAMNAARIGDEGSISDNLDFIKIIGSESFHPNALGHSLLANLIINTAGNIVTNDYCANGAIVCPVETPAPDPSAYWISGINHNYPAQKLATYVFSRDGDFDNRQKQIIIPNASLKPNSSVVVEITSNPRLLGQFQTSEDGSLAADIDLPTDLEEGYHTIHLYGTSYSGESIELYQIIEYLKPVAKIKDQPVAAVTDIPQTEAKQDEFKEISINIAQDEKPKVETQIAIVNEKIDQVIEEPTVASEQVHEAIVESDIISEDGVVKGASVMASEGAPLIANKIENNTDKTIPNNGIWHTVATIASVLALPLIGYATIRRLRR